MMDYKKAWNDLKIFLQGGIDYLILDANQRKAYSLTLKRMKEMESVPYYKEDE